MSERTSDIKPFPSAANGKQTVSGGPRFLRVLAALLFTLAVLAGITASAAVSAAEAKTVPGGTVSSPEELLEALGGEECAWLTGETATLRKDVSLSSALEFVSGSYTLVGAGSVITRGCEGALISVESGASLTLGGYQTDPDDISLIIDGGQQVGASPLSSDPSALPSPLLLINGGKVEVKDGTVLSNNYSPFGGGILIDGGELVFSGGHIEGCSADSGGGICLRDGSAVLTGGYIDGCRAVFGGAVCCSGGSFTLSGGRIGGTVVSDEFSGEKEKLGGNDAEYGGGICVLGTRVDLESGTVILGRAEKAGGGIYCDADGSVFLIGGGVTYCTAPEGGGVYCLGLLSVQNGPITRCDADRGGGLYVGEGGEAGLENADVVYCTARSLGGGAYIAKDGQIRIEHGAILEKCSAVIGGGLFNLGTVTLNGTIGNDDASLFGASSAGSGLFRLGGYAFLEENDLALIASYGKLTPIEIISEISTPSVGALRVIADYDAEKGSYTEYTENGAEILKAGEDAGLSGDAFTAAAAKFSLLSAKGSTLGEDGRLAASSFSPTIAVVAAAALLILILAAVILLRRRKTAPKSR